MKLNRYVFGAAAASLILTSSLAYATNGYFAHGYGPKSNGLAGAGVAFPQDAMAAATNPAGMVLVGARMDLGAALYSPHRQYSVSAITGGLGANGGTSGSTVTSDNEFFLIPHFGRNWMLTPDSAFGITVYGNGGMNTEYKAADTPFGAGTFQGGDAGVDLSQLFVVPTYSRKINQDTAWGVSAIVAYQIFEAKGLSPFAGLSSDSANLSGNGHDDSFGLGARIGFITQLNPSTTFGAAYQTKIDMDEFGKYAGLFAEQGDFDIPPTATIGLAWTTSANDTITADVQWIGYSDVTSVGNPLLPNLTMCPGFGGSDSSFCFGGSNGPGFGWEDITVVKIGYQWHSGPDWTWRVGYSHTDQPIPDSEVLLNILAPGVIEDHLTFGFTKMMGSDREFNFAAMYALEEKVTGVNTLGAPAGQNVELKMDQWQLEASWAWKY